MKLLKTGLAFILAAAGTYIFAVIFYTQQVIAKQAEVGAQYTISQQIDTYLENFQGLTQYAVVLSVALLIGFLVAWVVKRLLKPLAPIAYPVAGAAAVLVAISLIESLLGGGAGVIGGARTPFGMALQGFAGGLGGVIFATVRPTSD